MTELQILRSSLFDEISRIKRGTSTKDDVDGITKISNAIIQSYNTEIKAFSMIMEAQERGLKTVDVKIFNDSEIQKIDMVSK